MTRRMRKASRWSALCAGVVASGVLASASALATECTLGAVKQLDVPGLTQVTSVTLITSTPTNPFPVCQIVGRIETDDNTTGFQANLPTATWNRKFLFLGVVGLAGDTLPKDFATNFAAANVVDQLEIPFLGFAVVVTDTGHTAGTTDGSWALNANGTPNRAKLTDYYFRATHVVTVVGKRLVRAFYGVDIQRAYFDGCDNGGRQALMEASRFPEDYDGIIAGAPFMSIRAALAGIEANKQQLSPANFIPFTKLPMIDAATTASCDAADGVKDGLIQNPAACNFDPATLVKPACTNTDPTCLSPSEANTLRAFFTGARDDDGNVVYPGDPISNLTGGPGSDFGADVLTTGFLLPNQINFGSAEPWGPIAAGNQPITWQFVDNITRFFVERDANFDTRDFDGSTPHPFSDAALNLFDKRTRAGDADDPEKFRTFIAQNRKLIIYHGTSDPLLTPHRTVMFYEDLADGVDGGFEETQENVRLFLVPGMHHCLGGPGPNSFDTLQALDNWVEHGVAPEAIVAAHFPGNAPIGAPGTQDRTMPLCKFPEEAHFKGDPANAAQVKDATFWDCPANDRRALEVGLNGKEAGLGGRLAKDDNDDHEHGHEDGDHDRDDH